MRRHRSQKWQAPGDESSWSGQEASASRAHAGLSERLEGVLAEKELVELACAAYLQSPGHQLHELQATTDRGLVATRAQRRRQVGCMATGAEQAASRPHEEVLANQEPSNLELVLTVGRPYVLDA
mmetsp:Transcript_100451/g.283318  ORF Transcript_100451/g.283318 Transcript_100451/m.283318 type:complete len:125 (-) Transcript_100451:415-789(-)